MTSTTTIEDEGVLARALKDAEESAAERDHDVAEALREDTDPLPLEDEALEHDSELDDIEKQIAHREWVIKGPITFTRPNGSQEVRDFERTYVQKPLSFTSMLQFTGLIGERLSEAMSGPDGLTVDGAFGEGDSLVAAGRGIFSRDDFSSLDSFVRGLAKLAQYAPSIVEDCQCIWLRVQFNERPIVKEIWSRSPEDGGLSISEGQEMLEVFLAQNYQEVEDFFVERLPRLAKRIAALRNLKHSATGSRRSKHSKPTPDATPSQ
jgi:hypothetical protein